MKNVKKVLWVVMAMVLLTAGACADAGYPEFKDVEIAESEMLVGGEGEMCFDDGTCNEGLVCIEEICRIVFVKAECRDDGDCDEDLICEEGACVEDGPTDTPIAKGGLGDPCFDDGRCKVGLYCANDDMCHSMETVVVPPPRAGINSYDEPVGINRTWGVDQQDLVNEQGSIAAEAVHNSNRFEGYVPGETGADENQPCISGHICEEGLICVEGMCIDEDDYTIEFEDVRLERKIKGRLCETDELYCNSPEGEKIRYVDCQSMTYLDASESEIASLVGIEQCNALTVINLYKNNISDITPLASLADLLHLHIHVNNIEDISPLASLTDLVYLTLYFNNISDITPLASLANLVNLNLGENNISDITPLASLANLNYLYLHGNSIEDITTLVSLTELCDLFLSHNNIKNIEALYNNSGLGGPNDRVILGNNPLIGEYYFHNTSYVRALQGRGAHVECTEIPYCSEPGSWQEIQ